MKARDRLVLAGIAAGVLVIAVWLLLVAPERKQVSTLSNKITSERAALTSAQASLASARAAADGYVGDVRSVQNVTRAVPTSPAVAQVITTISKLAGTKIDWKTFDVGSGGPTAQGPVALGLTFTFASNYGNLQSFLSAIDALTTTDGTTVKSNGRLFTINSVSLQPASGGSTTASVVADVYQQPTGATGATGATG